MSDTHTAVAVPALILRRMYAAPRQRVFDAWTKPELLVRFLGPGDVTIPEVEMDVRTGGSYRIVMLMPDGERMNVGGIYREVRAPERLSMTWRWEEDDPSDEFDTLLTLEFNELDAGTELVLTHEQFASVDSRGRHEDGWTKIMDQLGDDLRLPGVVPHVQWLEARTAFLAQEKAFTRERDRLSQARRELPWERVETSYVFDGPDGKQTLPQLFGSARQLIVYHFMFDPDWDAGCKSCSFWADNFNGIPVHLRARDTALIAVSRAPIAKLEAYRKRMGWSFPWFSSFESDFNRDYGVTFTQDEIDGGTVPYNYQLQAFCSTEAPGVSVFFKDKTGAVYHTYSSYGRGIDILNGAYNYLDLTPKGRDEGDNAMAWLRRRDEY